VGLTYAAAGHTHAVSSTSTDNAYTYNSNGNMTTRHIVSGLDLGDYDLTYDTENRLINVTKNDTSIANFTFDGDGKRVKSVINGVTILFVGSHVSRYMTNIMLIPYMRKFS
jgi:YD repeat-containing protein